MSLLLMLDLIGTFVFAISGATAAATRRIQLVAPIEDFDFTKWKQMLAIHLNGAFLTTRAALKQMYKQGTGGSTACQAGAVSAPKELIRNVNSNNTPAVTRLSETSAAKTAAIAVLTTSPRIRKCRRSMISANAPAGMASRKIGRLAATWTSETISGSELRLVISQLEAACVHPGADIGDDAGSPDHRESWVAKRPQS